MSRLEEAAADASGSKFLPGKAIVADGKGAGLQGPCVPVLGGFHTAGAGWILCHSSRGSPDFRVHQGE